MSLRHVGLAVGEGAFPRRRVGGICPILEGKHRGAVLRQRRLWRGLLMMWVDWWLDLWREGERSRAF